MKTLVKNWMENNNRANRQAVINHASILGSIETKTENEIAFLSFAQVVKDAQTLEWNGALADVLYNCAFALATNLVSKL